MGRGKKIVDIDVVVEEAIALIEESGVEEFSTRRLAARLGISAMTLYNYYENRGAILGEALSQGLKVLLSGLSDKVSSWREQGGGELGVYKIMAEHFLAVALSRPFLCRFVLTSGAGSDWSDPDGQLELICNSIQEGGESGRSVQLRRDIYLFELLVFALTLKVIGGGETAEGFRELVTEGYERLLGQYDGVAAKAS